MTLKENHALKKPSGGKKKRKTLSTIPGTDSEQEISAI